MTPNEGKRPRSGSWEWRKIHVKATRNDKQPPESNLREQEVANWPKNKESRSDYQEKVWIALQQPE